jgi:hypothetical protein
MTYKLEDKITFGKYSERDLPKAMTIEEIIDQDPEYLVWCLDNVSGFDLHFEAMETLMDVTMVWEEDKNATRDI